jgi:hypothetical protein
MRTQIVLAEPSPDDDRPGFLVRTPYHEGFREEVKGLPTADRRWVPHEGAWWVAEDYREWAERRTQELFGYVEIVDEDGAIETISPGARSRQERLL